MVLHRPPQRLRFLHRFRSSNAALLLRAAHEHVAHVFNVEVVETELVLGEDAVEQLGQGGGADQKNSGLPDVEGVADRVVTAVDKSLQLRTQTVEIDRRGDDEHVGIRQLLVNEWHVVFLHTSVTLACETRVAPHARMHRVIVYRNDLHEVFL